MNAAIKNIRELRTRALLASVRANHEGNTSHLEIVEIFLAGVHVGNLEAGQLEGVVYEYHLEQLIERIKKLEQLVDYTADVVDESSV